MIIKIAEIQQARDNHHEHAAMSLANLTVDKMPHVPDGRIGMSSEPNLVHDQILADIATILMARFVSGRLAYWLYRDFRNDSHFIFYNKFAIDGGLAVLVNLNMIKVTGTGRYSLK